MRWILSLVESLAEPLRDANFQPLLTLAQAMKQTAQGNYTEATRLFDELPKTGNSAVVAGVTVNLPTHPVPAKSFTVETVSVNHQGQIIKRETKEAAYFTEDLGAKTTLDMVYIPRGRFMMGAPEGEAESDGDEKPQHQVTVKPFFMGKYPITQAQWQAVAKLPKIHYDLKSNPSHFKGKNRPVVGLPSVVLPSGDSLRPCAGPRQLRHRFSCCVCGCVDLIALYTFTRLTEETKTPLKIFKQSGHRLLA